jgi:hypothetical protein
MENNFDNQFTNDLAPTPAKPQFLKVLCILTFIMSGFWILLCFFGTLCLGLTEEKIASVWDKVLESQPHLENTNPAEFFHQVGIVSLMMLFANIASLVGAIMMWRLNKIGFFIYIVAELVTYFVSMDMGASANGSSSSLSTVVSIVFDIAFIAMYAVNLKHMNKATSNPS